jgi:hypothetical protein
MKWLTNMHDPRMDGHGMYVTRMSDESIQEAQIRERRWLHGKIIGDPQPTSAYTVEELKAINIVGIYCETEDVDATV